MRTRFGRGYEFATPEWSHLGNLCAPDDWFADSSQHIRIHADIPQFGPLPGGSACDTGDYQLVAPALPFQEFVRPGRTDFAVNFRLSQIETAIAGGISLHTCLPGRLAMFDTLKYSKILEAVGVPRHHAEAHVKIISEIVEGDLATKQDIKDLKDEMQKLEYRLIIKLGAMLTAGVAVTITVLKLILQ